MVAISNSRLTFEREFVVNARRRVLPAVSMFVAYHQRTDARIAEICTIGATPATSGIPGAAGGKLMRPAGGMPIARHIRK